MFRIVSVRFDEYFSNEIPKDLIKRFIMACTCESAGTLVLSLQPGECLDQKGPLLIAPRWDDTFEYEARFKIVCDVREC